MSARHVVVLLTVLLSSLMFPLQLTGASLALPGVSDELGADLTATQWIVNSYAGVFAAALAVAGTVADLLGRRRVFVAGVTFFFLGGLVSSSAGSVVVLVAGRALSGLGAAAAAASGAAILATTFQDAAKRRAFGLLGIVLGGGLAFGPMISGALVDLLGWRAVFGVPAVVAGLVLAMTTTLPADPGVRGRSFDWRGALLYSAPLLLLVVVLNVGPEEGFTSPPVLAAIAATVALGVAFVMVERRAIDPLFDLAIVLNRRFAAFAVAAAAFMGVLVPLVVYLPSYLITVSGVAPGMAGLWMLMMTVPTVLLPPVGSVLAQRMPILVFVPGSITLSGAGALLLVTIGPESTPLHLFLPCAAIGAGVGLTMGVLDGLAIDSVPVRQAGTANGLFNTARLATEAVALAAAGAVLAAVSAGTLHGDAFTEAFRAVCLALALFAMACAVGVVLLVRRA
ncbi:MFS transporter [Phytoactinopolyspora alkaliphila]|uniref:MFS transporter n=2 Tax=Phytoactinopolyspora alkaliphila TaxID=1783498 RepID=A0A6N9YJH4_9ACTN|nr:MFS transporter [Phytoactinopolyspora alkaliphila]NED95085.1 MFS transporter [Phytoactinopolyspora alkaliphila]